MAHIQKKRSHGAHHCSIIGDDAGNDPDAMDTSTEPDRNRDQWVMVADGLQIALTGVCTGLHNP